MIPALFPTVYSHSVPPPGRPLANEEFWQEWSPLRAHLSLPLTQLFNSIFVLEPSVRATLRQLASSPWLCQGSLTPEDIRQQMEAR